MEAGRLLSRKIGMRMYGQRCLFLHFVSMRFRKSWEKEIRSKLLLIGQEEFVMIYTSLLSLVRESVVDARDCCCC